MRTAEMLRRSLWARGTSLAPGLGLAVLAKFTCALCVVGYASVLSSLGLGFVATDRGLTALTVCLLVVNTASLAWSARRRGQRGPLVVATAGSLLVVGGRLLAVTPMLAIGTGLVIAASLWNLWLGRQGSRRLKPVSLDRAR